MTRRGGCVASYRPNPEIALESSAGAIDVIGPSKIDGIVVDALVGKATLRRRSAMLAVREGTLTYHVTRQ